MSLVTRVQVIAVTCVLVASALMLAVVGYQTDRRLQESIASSLASRLDTQSATLRDALSDSLNRLDEVLRGPALAAYLSQGDPAPLTRRLQALAGAHPDVLQARFIDTAGRERIRIDRRGDMVRVRTGAQLQDKSRRDYVLQMLQLAPGQVYLSPIDLNRENGVLDIPYMPTVRLAAPVFDAAGQRRGGLVLNLQGAQILPAARQGSVSLRVATADGSYLVHPQEAWRYAADLGSGRDFTAEFGRPLPAFDAPPVPLSLTGPDGTLDAAARWVAAPGGTPPQHWLLIASLPTTLRRDLAGADLLQSAGVVAVIAALAATAAWVAIRGTTRRLSQLVDVAVRIADGQRVLRISLDGRDEAGTLARALNQMTAQLQLMLSRERRDRNLLEITNAELKRSNAELEDFARATAHDLKTPLRALGVLPAWIEEDLGQIAPPLSLHLEEMKAQTARLEALVDGLLTYALIGRGPPQVEVFDPGPVVAHVLALLAPPPGFRIEVAEMPATLRMVRAEFEIALRTLVSNAIRHHDRPEGRIALRLRADRTAIVLEVEDDGPGIPEADRARVLLPLRTGKTKEDGGGAGLGLAFVAKIAARWNGLVEIEDAPGRGALLRLSLPAEMTRPASGLITGPPDSLPGPLPA